MYRVSHEGNKTGHKTYTHLCSKVVNDLFRHKRKKCINISYVSWELMGCYKIIFKLR